MVASFDQFEFRRVAPLFRRMAEHFELCVFGLNLVKSELKTISEPGITEFVKRSN